MEEEVKEKKLTTKEILVKVGKNLTLCVSIITLLSLNLRLYANLKKENNDDEDKDNSTSFKYYIRYADTNNFESQYANYADIYKAFTDNNLETETDEEIDQTETNEEETINNQILDEESVQEPINIDSINSNEDKTILESNGINSNLDSMAEEYDEELIIQENERYIKYVLELIYDINNDGISKQHKIDTICQLYKCSYDDIYSLYEMFVSSIKKNPTTNPYENVKNICSYITDKATFKNKLIQLKTEENLTDYDIKEAANDFITEYLNDDFGEAADILINTLYYKQINNTPLKTKLDYIYQRWDLTEEQLTILIECVLCEAMHHSYIDAYAVSTTLMNRMSSIKWTEGYDNIYEQLTKRFGVYYRGDYKCYDGLSLNDLIKQYEGASAVIDCLYTELPIHNATNFYGNGYEGKYRAKFTENGNNYFNENDQLSKEDRIPAEQLQNVIFEKNIILSFSKGNEFYQNYFDKYFNINLDIIEEERDNTLSRIK